MATNCSRPSQAFNCMRSYRNQYSPVMLLECKDCQHRINLPHSCWHRSCPHCQHQESQQLIERQRDKLLRVAFYLLTFPLPYEVRELFWKHQREAYDLLLKTARQTIASFASRDPRLRGRTGAHGVQHTHSCRLDYRPHLHLICDGRCGG